MTTGCGALCAPHPVASHISAPQAGERAMLEAGWRLRLCRARHPAYLCQALQPAIAVICSHVSPTAQSSASPASTPAS